MTALVDVADMRVLSALSLRVFSEDLTVAGRQASTKKNETVKPEEDSAHQTPVPDHEEPLAVRGAETEGTVSTTY